jgi:hypothetical protein
MLECVAYVTAINNCDLPIYQFHVYLREISPMICHLFLSRSKWYGVSRLYGAYLLENGRDVQLYTFQFRPYEWLLYQYNFGNRWEQEIRFEKTLPLDPTKTYPVCIRGKQRKQSQAINPPAWPPSPP